MKKQFFYAALAIGMMSSCSSNDLPGNQAPEEQLPEEERVAISIGIDVPTVVSTRGTGSVGSTEEAQNKWNGQDLGIFMVQKGTMQAAIDNGTYIFQGESFRAPYANVENNNGKSITFTTGNVKYYPMQGSFDFYGYHFDGTNVALSANPASDATQEMTLTGEIDGSNDVMAAVTKLSAEDKAKLINSALGTDSYIVNGEDITKGGTSITDASNADDLAKLNVEIAKTFSSYASRRGVQPRLNFKHLLSRLKFNVRAGEDKAALENYSGTTVTAHFFPATTQVEDGECDPSETAVYGEAAMTDQAVYIRSLKVTNQKYDLTVTYTPDVTPALTAADLTLDDPKGTFTLMQRTDNATNEPAKKLETLKPVAPEKKPNTPTPDPTAIGESMMIVPGEHTFDVEIQVMQYVMTNDGNGTATVTPGTPEYKWKLYTLKTKVNAPGGESAIFEAGKSYNVNITVYGFQKIEVFASLEGWIDGGTVESNPEDEVFNQGI